MTNYQIDSIKEFEEYYGKGTRSAFDRFVSANEQREIKEWVRSHLQEAYKRGREDEIKEIITMLGDKTKYTWIDVEGENLLREIVNDLLTHHSKGK